MSYNSLKKNLERLVKDNDYQIAELERRASLKKNNVYNILKGITKKPSAEILQAIADVFGITVKDLYNDYKLPPAVLNDADYSLLIETCSCVIKCLQKEKVDVSCADVTILINETFSFAKDNNADMPDEKFIKWQIKYKFIER
jgi:transcriptional regulator with XRE-family HTH domain